MRIEFAAMILPPWLMKTDFCGFFNVRDVNNLKIKSFGELLVGGAGKEQNRGIFAIFVLCTEIVW